MPLNKDGYPRAYLWLCGCHGVSYDGKMAGVVTCKQHQFRLDDLALSPLEASDYYVIDRLCREAFRHLMWPTASRYDRKNAIAAIEAAQGEP